MQNSPSVRLCPITLCDLPRVGRFLHENLNSRISAADWASYARPSWGIEAPNHGYMLVDGDIVVGAHMAFYSRQMISGNEVEVCNLAAWCVLKAHRFQGLRMLKALLDQPGYEFTDLSPSGNVVPLNKRLHFQTLDTTSALVANLPWPLITWRTRIVSDRASIEPLLHGRDLEIYRDHARAAAAYHLVIVDGAETCYVIFRRDRRKRLPLFASILYVGNPGLFQKRSSHVFRHLLLRHWIPATFAELRIVDKQPRFSMLMRARTKMFRSDVLKPHQIEYLYSELMCVAW